MYYCASCTVHACRTENRENLPECCPMRDGAFYDEVAAEYQKEEIRLLSGGEFIELEQVEKIILG